MDYLLNYYTPRVRSIPSKYLPELKRKYFSAFEKHPECESCGNLWIKQLDLFYRSKDIILFLSDGEVLHQDQVKTDVIKYDDYIKPKKKR